VLVQSVQSFNAIKRRLARITDRGRLGYATRAMPRSAAALFILAALAVPTVAQAGGYLTLTEAWVVTQKKTYRDPTYGGVAPFDSPRTDCHHLTDTVVDCGWHKTMAPGTECLGTMRVRMTRSYKITAHRLRNTKCHPVVFRG
jgi:hypothetical protein